jgi:hypothetical protein
VIFSSVCFLVRCLFGSVTVLARCEVSKDADQNSGVIEGNVNRITMTRRQMCGRAGFRCCASESCSRCAVTEYGQNLIGAVMATMDPP